MRADDNPGRVAPEVAVPREGTILGNSEYFAIDTYSNAAYACVILWTEIY